MPVNHSNKLMTANMSLKRCMPIVCIILCIYMYNSIILLTYQTHEHVQYVQGVNQSVASVFVSLAVVQKSLDYIITLPSVGIRICMYVQMFLYTKWMNPIGVTPSTTKHKHLLPRMIALGLKQSVASVSQSVGQSVCQSQAFAALVVVQKSLDYISS